MLDVVPNPVAIQIGPIPVYWYGIGYALGLAAAYLVLTRIGRRAGEDDELVGNGMIIVAIAALIGGRLYHVIDQWQLYKDDLLKIVLPPYSGLGVYGGIITGTIGALLYARWKHAPFGRWADIVAPALFTMQAVARWGNFFNQELYGPPTTLPWGIPIDCAHRIPAYPCEQFPLETTAFHPLFLYESLSGVLGAIVLIWLGFHIRRHLRVGDLMLTFFVWYGAVRFVLEGLRADNWTFFGVPTAQVVSVLFIIPALVILLWRHRPGHPLDDPPTNPEVATWGAPGRPVETLASVTVEDGAAEPTDAAYAESADGIAAGHADSVAAETVDAVTVDGGPGDPRYAESAAGIAIEQRDPSDAESTGAIAVERPDSPDAQPGDGEPIAKGAADPRGAPPEPTGRAAVVATEAVPADGLPRPNRG